MCGNSDSARTLKTASMQLCVNLRQRRAKGKVQPSGGPYGFSFASSFTISSIGIPSCSAKDIKTATIRCLTTNQIRRQKARSAGMGRGPICDVEQNQYS